MRADRILIVAVVVLGTGLWDILEFCKGNAGLAFAVPVSASKVSFDITTMGWPVLTGVPLVVIGSILMLIAFFAAIVAQFRRERMPVAVQDPPIVSRDKPFEG